MRSDFPLDRIIFIPVGIPPHKEDGELSSAKVRVEMMEAAIEGYPYFEISEWEIRRKKVSYTTETIRHFLQSEDELFLIIGADCLLELDAWKDPEWILGEIQTLVVGRPSFKIEDCDKRFRKGVTFVQVPLIEISSTEIRRRVRGGKSIRNWVPDKVEEYIRKKGLYL